ncbi:MAG: DMT family transporter [Pseudoruegeria sp.]
MSQDRPVLGILFMLGFCVLAPMGDAMAKLLGDTMAVAELAYLRFLFQMIILLPIALLTGVSLHVSRMVLSLIALRTVFHILGLSFMFLSLRYLPLAEAVAIAFVMPFIMLLLGKYVLHEEIGPRRFFGCVVGFIGTMLVVQPSFVEVGAPALLPLGVAVFFALFMLVTRSIAKQVDPIGMQTLSGGIAVVILFPVLLWTDLSVSPVRTDLPGFDLTLIFMMGILGTVAHLFMTWSLRYAPSATLAPMQYLEIPIATLIGWLVFKDFPNGLAALGILITMTAGLYIIFREHAVQRQNATSLQKAHHEAK